MFTISYLFRPLLTGASITTIVLFLPFCVVHAEAFVRKRFVPLGIEERLRPHRFRDGRSVALAPITDDLMFDTGIDADVLVVGKTVQGASNDKGTSAEETGNQRICGRITEPSFSDTVRLDLALWHRFTIVAKSSKSDALQHCRYNIASPTFNLPKR